MDNIGCSPLTVTVTTRIITLLVGATPPVDFQFLCRFFAAAVFVVVFELQYNSLRVILMGRQY